MRYTEWELCTFENKGSWPILVKEARILLEWSVRIAFAFIDEPDTSWISYRNTVWLTTKFDNSYEGIRSTQNYTAFIKSLSVPHSCSFCVFSILAWLQHSQSAFLLTIAPLNAGVRVWANFFLHSFAHKRHTVSENLSECNHIFNCSQNNVRGTR
jgi:hypothetical protein